MTDDAYNAIHKVLVHHAREMQKKVDNLKKLGYSDMTEDEWDTRQSIIHDLYLANQAIDLLEQHCG